MTTKQGRFWALKAHGKLLAIVLYKTGRKLPPLLRGKSGREAEAPARESDPGDCTCHGDHMTYFAYGSNMDIKQMSKRFRRVFERT